MRSQEDNKKKEKTKTQVLTPCDVLPSPLGKERSFFVLGVDGFLHAIY